MSGRCFLFLQGPASPFFSRLGTAIRARGHRTLRVNLCTGDRLFWRGGRVVNYRGRFAAWPGYVAALMGREGVIDLVVFGDCRPYHRAAIAAARTRTIRCYAIEEGYLRPDWITLEEGGVNGHSGLPRDPAALLAAAERHDRRREIVPAGGGFANRIIWDVIYNCGTELAWFLYPGYRRYRARNPLIDYGGWLLKWGRTALGRRRRHERRLAAFLASDRPFYLLPLQLDSDFQVTAHSPFADMEEMQDHVIESFARHAPRDSRLLVKAHPLDNGLVNRVRQTARIAARHGVAGRVLHVATGHLPSIFRRVRGVITVNSTVGPSALFHRCPTIALGTAIYDVPGLTFQHGLDRFWREGRAPDGALLAAFRRVVIQRALVNGSFFTRRGIARGVAETTDRLLAPPDRSAAAPAAQPRPIAPTKPSALPAE